MRARLERWRGRFKLGSVRVRLLVLALLPMLVILPLLLGVSIVRWNAKYDAVLISKVHGDLTIAHQYFTRILDNTGEHITSLGRSAQFSAVIAGRDPSALKTFLAQARQRLGLDFLYLVDADGHDVATAPDGGGASEQPSSPVVASALGGQPKTAVDIFTHAQLAAISPQLAERASIDLIATPNAVPTERKKEQRGMVVHSASPALLGDGREGALVGGILLNRNLVFIDTINDLVYREASLPEGSRGTATLFLEDVRVSTNVRLFADKRALGTRVSAAVRDAVLNKGRVWLDRAFVVNDWYISAYEPIQDSYGKRVGMLYVGFLEAPFRDAKRESWAIIILIFLVVSAAVIPFFLRWARGIFKPLEHMSDTIARVENGDLGARTSISQGDNEIGRVAVHLDHLLNQVQERDRQLRSWNEELNARVAERTGELTEANKQLETATKQLVMSEKLAAIGEITAGVAHEINNPVSVIQGNLEVLRDLIGEKAETAKTELRLIDEQTDRISQIVTKLLQFAKPEEYAGFVERYAPDDIVGDCLPLVRHLLKRNEIDLIRENTATRLVLMNRTELQQVLINLIVNAIHASANGGQIRVCSYDAEQDGEEGVCISVRDEGAGMGAETLERIFDPFFTTKRQGGTGLGLSISQTLVNRHGGRITVESVLGKGTSFCVFLPQTTD